MKKKAWRSNFLQLRKYFFNFHSQKKKSILRSLTSRLSQQPKPNQEFGMVMLKVQVGDQTVTNVFFFKKSSFVRMSTSENGHETSTWYIGWTKNQAIILANIFVCHITCIVLYYINRTKKSKTFFSKIRLQ